MENKSIKNIHWFPGHMKKASNLISEKLKLVDFVIVLLDSRIPLSSYNPYLMDIIKDKKKVFLLTKEDLSDEEESLKRKEKLSKDNDLALIVDLKNQKVINDILNLINIYIEEKKEKYLKKGIKNVSIRAMVVGIPNVGKSTFINLMAKKSIALSKNEPGVTKSVRWIKVNKNFELMDTPGILLPQFKDKKSAINLALLGTIKEEILPLDELFTSLMSFIKKYYLKEFNLRYKTDFTLLDKDEDILEVIAKKRGFINKDNQVDNEKTIKVILNEFRNGIIGKFTIERVEDANI